MKRAGIGFIIAFALQSMNAGSMEGESSPEPALRAAASAIANDPAAAVSRRTPIRILTPPKVEWPGVPDREALVYLILSISAQGTVSNIEVDDRGFHEYRFVDAARRGAQAMRFAPATLDGVPVAFCAILPVAFPMGQFGGEKTKWMTGVSEEFRSGLNKIEKSFAKKDYDGVRRQAESLGKRVRFAYEYAVLQAELAQLHASLGHHYPALRAAEAATIRTTPNLDAFDLEQPISLNKASNYLLPVEVISRLLQVRMNLSADSGALLNAFRAYQELAGLENVPPNSSNDQLAAQIKTVLKGKDPLIASGVLGFGDWRHDLFRSRFTIAQVQGSIKSIALVCGDKRLDIRYVKDTIWTVPATWEGCTVSVVGSAETTFSLVELADGVPPTALVPGPRPLHNLLASHVALDTP